MEKYQRVEKVKNNITIENIMTNFTEKLRNLYISPRYL